MVINADGSLFQHSLQSLGSELNIYENITPQTFFLSYSDLFLPNNCRCTGLLFYFITLIETHTHTRYDSSKRGIGTTQRPLPDDTRHSQETDVHVLVGNRNRNSSKPADADPSLRPRGHRERHAPSLADASIQY